MQNSVSFVLDNRIVSVDFNSDRQLSPTTTVLNYLRNLPNHKGVKEGCAEGDCGACTVVFGVLTADGNIQYRNIDSCLVFLPSLHGKLLVTIENLEDDNGNLHVVQSAMTETGGSQCGFCTPGIVMSLFSLYKNHNKPTREQIDNSITGNLCRCTGYKPIVEAAAQACVHNKLDHFTQNEPNVISLLHSISKDSVYINSNNQEYFLPSNLSEALILKSQHPDAIVISGSTDIALRVTKGHETLKQIIDLSRVNEAKQFQNSSENLIIGSGINLTDVQQIVQNDFPALYDMLQVFGSQQIRNVATLGGNLGTASPISDTLPVLMAYNATVILQNIKQKHEILLEDYIIGYRKTTRTPDELIVGIKLPKNQNGTIIKSYKISKRKDLDISTISAGFRLELDNKKVKSIKLVYGGMAEHTKRAASIERFVIGKKWEREVIEEAMQLINRDFTPLSDARGSAEFRLIAAKNLILKFWTDTQ